MKKIFLQKVIQHNAVSYIGKADPRDLVKVATKIAMGEVQDSQRPLSEKRVKEIAKYINENGILPNTLTLATKDNRIEVKPVEGLDDLYFIDFPSTAEEFEQFKDSIDVMDGQHRLYSFLDDLRLLSDSEKFEIGFTLFIIPTLNEKRRIFISCNEKQEKVSGNLLMWFKEKLEMLTSDEKEFFKLVSDMNKNYPLNGRIIMGAEKVTGGFKANQVMEILRSSHIQDFTINGRMLSNDQKLRVITNYLRAWERVCDFTFCGSSPKIAGAAVKIAGFRYMMLLLKPVWERSINLRQKFDIDFVESVLKKMIDYEAVKYDEFFTCDDHKMWFRDRTAISNAASIGERVIRSLDSETFDPLS